MQIKENKKITALVFTCQTTLGNITKYVGIKARELFKSAVENGFDITGPVYWIYTGADGNPETQFTLEICLPIQNYNHSYDGAFQVKQLPNFKCVSIIHNGPWPDMYKTYSEVIGYVLQNGYKMSGTNRELYINVDFINLDSNITEIQIGII